MKTLGTDSAAFNAYHGPRAPCFQVLAAGTEGLFFFNRLIRRIFLAFEIKSKSVTMIPIKTSE
jgi:hypothetical protein